MGYTVISESGKRCLLSDVDTISEKFVLLWQSSSENVYLAFEPKLQFNRLICRSNRLYPLYPSRQYESTCTPRAPYWSPDTNMCSPWWTCARGGCNLFHSNPSWPRKCWYTSAGTGSTSMAFPSSSCRIGERNLWGSCQRCVRF